MDIREDLNSLKFFVCLGAAAAPAAAPAGGGTIADPCPELFCDWIGWAFLRGLPQFLQNLFVSGFSVPHSVQNIVDFLFLHLAVIHIKIAFFSGTCKFHLLNEWWSSTVL